MSRWQQWALIAALVALVPACKSKDAAEVDSAEVVAAEAPPMDEGPMTAHAGSAVVYGDEETVGAAGSGGWGGDAQHTPSTSGARTATPHSAGSVSSAGSVEAASAPGAFAWYKPWTWHNKPPSDRTSSWRERSRASSDSFRARQAQSQENWRNRSASFREDHAARTQAAHERMTQGP